MNESTTDSRIVARPTGQDVLTEVLRDGARKMLAQDVEAEVDPAETKEAARKAFDLFVATYGAKSPKTTGCLEEDRVVLPTFYDDPAEHRVHIRTTNPIESVSSTVRLRPDKTKGKGSRATRPAMVDNLMESASTSWRSLNGSPPRAEVIKGTVFIDGIQEKPAAREFSKHDS